MVVLPIPATFFSWRIGSVSEDQGNDAVKIRDGRALHDSQVKQRLGIAGVSTNLYSWRSKSSGEADERAAQIDMVIERGDNTINLCEMKFSEGEFAINKDYDKILRNKIARFMEETKTRKSIQLTFISSYGLQRNMYSGIAQNEVVLDDLF